MVNKRRTPAEWRGFLFWYLPILSEETLPIGTVQAHNNFYMLTICKQAFALIQNFKMFQNQHIF